MITSLGPALSEFENRVKQLRAAVDPYPELAEALFPDTPEWLDLLTYKLVPHLGGAGCLIVAVAGGTNTGKSTVFNLLNGAPLSPIVNTAAATCHPVLAANAERAAECLEGKLVPEFNAQRLERPEAATDHDLPDDVLLIARNDALPESLALMDTPDVDSIDKANWAIADHIRAAGDVIVAVVTAEKYRDKRVVDFFRSAAASGRVVVPLMNKANPADDFAVARAQLAEFQGDVGDTANPFVIAHDFEMGSDLDAPIRGLGNSNELRAYLQSFDVAAVKEAVYRNTVHRFAADAAGFVDHARAIRDGLETIADDFECESASCAGTYDPAPGAAIGGLFHEFVQSKRGPIRRAIGSTSKSIVRGVGAIGRGIGGLFTTSSSLDQLPDENPAEINERHRQQIRRIARELAAGHIEAARRLSSPATDRLVEAATALSIEQASEEVVNATMRAEDVSEEFREHALSTLDEWWDDHAGSRRALESLDTLLAVMPAGIAVPISIYTGGVGAGEAAAVAGAMTATFVAKVMELQFGDAMFDFLSPWKAEQQQILQGALIEHITEPCLAPLRDMVAVVDPETLDAMAQAVQTCQTA